MPPETLRRPHLISLRGPASSRPGRTVRRLLHRHGRLLSAVAVLVATAVLVNSFTQPSGVSLTVAAHDLSAGQVLNAADLKQVITTEDGSPSAALAGPALIGARLAAPVRAGEPITDARLAVTAALAGDEVAVPVPVPGGTLHWVQPGDRLLLLASPPTDYAGLLDVMSTTAGSVSESIDPTTVLDATESTRTAGSPPPVPIGPVLVLQVPRGADTTGYSMLSGTDNTPTILVRTRREDLSRLADAAARGSLWPAVMP